MYGNIEIIHQKLSIYKQEMIDILRSESRVTLRVLPPVGLKDQPRYTPRELAHSIPRVPTLKDLLTSI